jgi:hypothetical protein
MFDSLYHTILYKVGPLTHGDALVLVLALYGVSAVCAMIVWLAMICALDSKRWLTIILFTQAAAYCAALRFSS